MNKVAIFIFSDLKNGVMKHLAVRLMGLQPLTILNNLVAKYLLRFKVRARAGLH